MSLTTIKKINIIVSVFLASLSIILFVYGVNLNSFSLILLGFAALFVLLGINIFVFYSSAVNADLINLKQRNKIHKNL
ncbi:MAG: hypothetical protein SO176_04415 [Bacilli bacterium]|nr:hypothetical protein [Bacilli bacterium]